MWASMTRLKRFNTYHSNMTATSDTTIISHIMSIFLVDDLRKLYDATYIVMWSSKWECMKLCILHHHINITYIIIREHGFGCHLQAVISLLTQSAQSRTSFAHSTCKPSSVTTLQSHPSSPATSWSSPNVVFSTRYGSNPLPLINFFMFAHLVCMCSCSMYKSM